MEAVAERGGWGGYTDQSGYKCSNRGRGGNSTCPGVTGGDGGHGGNGGNSESRGGRGGTGGQVGGGWDDDVVGMGGER